MSSFFITGKQGNGKSLIAVARIFDYLRRGNKVATNLDIKLEGYLSPQSKKSFLRVPDKPTVQDFEFLGIGNAGYDEEKNGLLVLDELGAWFNTRSWQDKERKKLLEWFLYLRKRGWDVYLIVQDIDMVDGQLRGMLGEHLVTCRRLDRIKIPLIGNLFKLIGLKGTLPKIHRAKVYFGETVQDLHVDTWTYRGTDFYSAYDTKQIFSPNYEHGIHSVLSPWHSVGRYLPAKLTFREKFLAFWDSFLEHAQPRPALSFALKPKHPLIYRIMRLPDDRQRLDFFRRFDSVGAFRPG
jgi:hypothetical protein